MTFYFWKWHIWLCVFGRAVFIIVSPKYEYRSSFLRYGSGKYSNQVVLDHVTSNWMILGNARDMRFDVRLLPLWRYDQKSQRHVVWKLADVVTRYIEESISNKKRVCNIIKSMISGSATSLSTKKVNNMYDLKNRSIIISNYTNCTFYIHLRNCDCYSFK